MLVSYAGLTAAIGRDRLGVMIWLAAFLAVLGTGTWLGARRLATDVDAIGAASALAAGIMLLRGVAIALGLGAAVLIILGI